MHVRTIARLLSTVAHPTFPVSTLLYTSTRHSRQISLIPSFLRRFIHREDALVHQSKKFLDRVTSSEPEEHYEELVKLRDGVQLSKEQLQVLRENVTRAMQLLSESATEASAPFLLRVFREAERTWDFTLSLDMHRHLFNALIRTGQLEEAKHWMFLLLEPAPSAEDWNRLLSALFSSEEYNQVLETFWEIKDSQGSLDTESFAIYIRAIFAIVPPPLKPYQIMEIRHEATRYGVSVDENLLSALLDGFELAGNKWEANKVSRELTALVKQLGSSDPNAWNALVRDLFETKGRKLALVKVQEMHERGIPLADRTFEAFGQRVQTVEGLRELELELKASAPVKVWEVLIANVVVASGTTTAIAVLRQAKTSGVPITASLVQPILNKLCGSGPKPPGWSQIQQAMDIYLELHDSEVAARARTDKSPSELSFVNHLTYRTLLRPLSTNAVQSTLTDEQRQKSFSFAMGLLADMRTFRIPMDSGLAASTLVLLMRNSGSFTEAFNTYRAMVRHEFESTIDGDAAWDAKHSPRLDQLGFQTVLHEFCNLKFPSRGGADSPPPAELYFSIVRDMQELGFEVTEFVYMTLLHRFGMTASSIRARNTTLHLAAEQLWDSTSKDNDVIPPQAVLATNNNIHSAIRYTHNHLTLNPSLTPSGPLLGVLMNAYNRVGAFTEAMRVWDTIRVNRLQNPHSISILYDTLGYAGATQALNQAQRWLEQEEWQYNGKNWQSLLEALCRVGQLNNAFRLMVLDYEARTPSRSPRNSPTPRPPLRRVFENDEDRLKQDVEGALILLGFSRTVNRTGELKSMLQRQMPLVWERVVKSPLYRP